MSDPPVPLPRPNPYDTPYPHDAYQKCLDLESRHHQVQKCGTLPVLIGARLIGYLLLEAPTDAGSDYLASEILRCDKDEGLQLLAQTYKDHLLRFVCASQKCRTPIPDDHYSVFQAYSVMETEEDALSLRSTETDAEDSHLKAKFTALVRDEYRCSLTGYAEYLSPDGCVIGNIVDVCPTELVHILPQCTGQGHLGKEDNEPTTGTVLSQYWQIDALKEFDGDDFHRLGNVFTVNVNYRRYFERLRLWLERKPEDLVNHYRMGSTTLGLRVRMKERIVFNTPNAKTIPVPDPRYLALHAALARAAHLSGAGIYIKNVLNDTEGEVLANDESSDTLYNALVRRLDVEAC